MTTLLSNSEIQCTLTYKNAEKMYQLLLMRYSTKKTISDAVTIFKNTGVIPSDIGGNTLRVVKELIAEKPETWYDEEKEARMNIIGQNGNEGTHYENEKTTI